MAFTGSLINHVVGNSQSLTPEIGMGATLLAWTDRNPATIVAVSPSGKSVTVREDSATRTDNNGLSESQSYTFEPNPDGYEETYTLRKNGSWIRKGSGMRDGSRLAIGRRDKYRDPSF